MTSMFNDPSILVHLAATFYVCGFLVRDQLILRSLIFSGTLCYLSYYYFAMDPPLWDAFFWSLVMGFANFSMILRLFLERTTFNLSPENKELYQVFKAMTPGEFRRLLKQASWHDGDESEPLTEEGKAVECLYYVLMVRPP